MAQTVLQKEFKELSKERWVQVDLDEDNIFRWNIVLFALNTDSPYHGGYLKCSIAFPRTYPYSPPDFRFSQPLWHPNIYPDGRICISILHAPGDDIMSGESAGERWSPAQRVESVLISILSLLDDPEISSPANVDASVMYRDDRDAFNARVRQDIEKTRLQMPKGFIMPTQDSVHPVVQKADDDDFWNDSDGEADFGDFDDDDMDNGSDTDGGEGESEDEEED